MFEIVTGQLRHETAARELRDVLTDLAPNGTLYLGYPIIATADEPIVFDALLTTREHGVVVFDLSGASRYGSHLEQIEQHQDELYSALFQKLLSFRELREGRTLAVNVNVVTLAPTTQPALSESSIKIASREQLPALLRNLPPITSQQLERVNAAIQRITTIKPANKRPNAQHAGSRGSKMREIEREIANLDQWQKKAAIESPEGPQRVRGLAGSGKTVVLALKAAYLHAQNPEWDIAVTFHTRALRQQFEDLVRRFCFEHLNDAPNWTKLRILHSWGSGSSPGIYSEIATKYGAPVRDFMSAKSTFGQEKAFQGVCTELLEHMKARGRFAPMFDAVLIDEAQDLPQPFFELVYRVTRSPHRIVWAYDELQNLGSYLMAPPSQLFGKDKSGVAFVPDVANVPNQPLRDIMLPVCYRNSPWALTVAHALGFGIYRPPPEPLVQYFDSPKLWTEVGYTVTQGTLDYGQQVTLERHPDSYPEYFPRLLDTDDAVVAKSFGSQDEQAEWVAAQIAQNVSDEELELSDILVVLPNPLTARTEAARIIGALNKYDIPAHLAGVTSSVDRIFKEDSVAISGIFRAKGNEAPMVYILDSDYCRDGYDVGKRRNILFTAITRSRAWVRILGIGDSMDALIEEIDSVRANGNKLVFRVPTQDALKRIRTIQRDVSEKSKASIRQLDQGLSDTLRQLDAGILDVEDLPLAILEKMQRILKKPADPDETQ